MAKNNTDSNAEGYFLRPKMTPFSAVGATGKIIVDNFNFMEGGRPLTLLHSPLTPTTDHENEGVSTAPVPRSQVVRPSGNTVPHVRNQK